MYDGYINRPFERGKAHAHSKAFPDPAAYSGTLKEPNRSSGLLLGENKWKDNWS